MQALLRDLASQRRALSAEERPYEMPFDKRAIDAVGDAISMGILPAIKVKDPMYTCQFCLCCKSKAHTSSIWLTDCPAAESAFTASNNLQ
jgi:hypothetical protein